MQVFITKYALTKGIFEAEAEVFPERDMIRVTGENGYDTYFHGEGKDWHGSLKDAKKRSEEMRKKKISTLEKQLEKVKNLSCDKTTVWM